MSAARFPTSTPVIFDWPRPYPATCVSCGRRIKQGEQAANRNDGSVWHPGCVYAWLGEGA